MLVGTYQYNPMVLHRPTWLKQQAFGRVAVSRWEHCSHFTISYRLIFCESLGVNLLAGVVYVCYWQGMSVY